MIEFDPSFPLEELKERVNNGYFDEEVCTYLLETLKEDSNDSKELMSGEISPYDFFTLIILEKDKGWRSHYISSTEHGTVDKEIIDLLKNRIDMLFEKAKSDLGINEETTLEVPVQEQYQNAFKNGSKIKINISIEFSNVNKNDFFEILQYFAQCSRKFYLLIAEKFNNKP